MRFLVLMIATFILTGCNTSFRVPNTLGDPKNAPSYGYHPLDPLPVQYNGTAKSPLDDLPDETMRMAVGSVSADGSITFGPAKVGMAGRNYIVILDYIKFNTASFGVEFSKSDTPEMKTATVTTQPAQINAVVPVYIGVGLRLTANIHVIKGSIDLTSLFGLGAAAKAEQVMGTLVIQTLGLSGPEISGLIPLPSEISDASIQNAILALASIKAKMYDGKTIVVPRVVAVYNTLGGGAETINGFISALLETPISFPNNTRWLMTDIPLGEKKIDT